MHTRSVGILCERIQRLVLYIEADILKDTMADSYGVT